MAVMDTKSFVRMSDGFRSVVRDLEGMPILIDDELDWKDGTGNDLTNCESVLPHLDSIIQHAAALTEAICLAADPETTARFSDLYAKLNEVLLEDIQISIAHYRARLEDEQAAADVGDNAADDAVQAGREENV